MLFALGSNLACKCVGEIMYIGNECVPIFAQVLVVVRTSCIPIELCIYTYVDPPSFEHLVSLVKDTDQGSN